MHRYKYAPSRSGFNFSDKVHKQIVGIQKTYLFSPQLNFMRKTTYIFTLYLEPIHSVYKRIQFYIIGRN